jgi:aspartate/methionine/tyrosine aminotransferase
MMNNPVSGRMRAAQAPVIPVIAAMIRERSGAISLGQGVAWYGPQQRALEEAVLKVQDTNLICAPGVSQLAAIGAMETGSA